ncbi:MAG: hypothetical protein BWY08_01428 [Bacteroidetes bacterium ADurb.Bin174]|nr:MAG: hypothetical protein BWY08_01428 [Bacteroidetes bacterium ADurb.Bin174]
MVSSAKTMVSLFIFFMLLPLKTAPTPNSRLAIIPLVKVLTKALLTVPTFSMPMSVSVFSTTSCV